MVTINGVTLYSVQDVMDMFKIKNRGTIKAWIDKGDLPTPKQLGRSMYWDDADIAAAREKRFTYFNTQDVMNLVGIKSRNTLYSWIHRGQFPKPDIDNGHNRWNPITIHNWMGERHEKSA